MLNNKLCNRSAKTFHFLLKVNNHLRILRCCRRDPQRVHIGLHLNHGLRGRPHPPALPLILVSFQTGTDGVGRIVSVVKWNHSEFVGLVFTHKSAPIHSWLFVMNQTCVFKNIRRITRPLRWQRWGFKTLFWKNI